MTILSTEDLNNLGVALESLENASEILENILVSGCLAHNRKDDMRSILEIYARSHRAKSDLTLLLAELKAL